MSPNEKYDESDKPPPFSLYKAQSKKVDTFAGKDDIASHDPHINSDGEALNRFILDEIQNPPVFRIFIYGYEYSNRTGTYQNNEDFSFYIDIPVPPELTSLSTQWSVNDNEPAFRGRSSREIEKDGKTESASSSQVKAYIKERDARRKVGLPPWVMDLPGDQLPLLHDGGDVVEYLERSRVLEQNAWKSSKSLRDWADDYCAASRSVKEFTFQQVTYGWNIEKLEKLIIETVMEKLHYPGSLEIDHWNVRGRIYVRPDNTLSKLMSKLWHSGGIWKTCGVAYPLIGWVDAQDEEQDAVKTPAGFKKRIGMTEEEWYQRWEETIIDALKKNIRSKDPLICPIEI